MVFFGVPFAGKVPIQELSCVGVLTGAGATGAFGTTVAFAVGTVVAFFGEDPIHESSIRFCVFQKEETSLDFVRGVRAILSSYMDKVVRVCGFCRSSSSDYEVFRLVHSLLLIEYK